MNFFLNSGYNSNTKANGGQIQYRRWSEMIQQAFLCKDLPSLRASDAVRKIQTVNVNEYTPPFRKNTKCMQCHASIDPMAAVTRNFSVRGNIIATQQHDSEEGIAYIQKFAPTRPDPGHYVNTNPKEVY